MAIDTHLYVRVIPTDGEEIVSEEGEIILRKCLTALAGDDLAARVFLHPRGGYGVQIHPGAHLKVEDILKHLVLSGYRPVL